MTSVLGKGEMMAALFHILVIPTFACLIAWLVVKVINWRRRAWPLLLSFGLGLMLCLAIGSQLPPEAFVGPWASDMLSPLVGLGLGCYWLSRRRLA